MGEGNFITTLFAMFLALLATIAIIFDLSQGFLFELFILIILLIIAMSTIGKIKDNRTSGWKLSAFFFIVMIINFLYLTTKIDNFTLFNIGIIASVIGFIVAIINMRPKKAADREEEIRRKAAAGVQPIKQLKEGEVLKGTPKVELFDYKTNKTYDSKHPVYNPKYRGKGTTRVTKVGKYLTSLTGKLYHDPDCEQARRIKSKNRVWLADEKEAKRKKLKACKCVAG